MRISTHASVIMPDRVSEAINMRNDNRVV
jgi:hypothetical protein